MTEFRVSPSPNGVTWLDIAEEQAGQRIDNFLLALLKGVPRSRIYRLLRKGEVRVNNGRTKPEYKLLAGDRLRLPPVRTAPLRVSSTPPLALQQSLTDRVVSRGEGWLVLDKPAGLAVHGGSGVALGVIEALRAIWPDRRSLELVHRLDRDTSGCLLIASARSALLSLQRQMRDGAMEKKYLALVAGRWPDGLREVSAPLRKNTLSSGERRVRADVDGKPALTRFTVVRRLPGFTLVEARLATGRTHQIRVHCQLMGHPVAGDPKYGARDANQKAREFGLRRMFLHAAELIFEDPATQIQAAGRAPLPHELAEVLRRLAELPG
ncbi:MAG: RluA family pseudouridine synthase [Porticoccaceae bacterium]